MFVKKKAFCVIKFDAFPFKRFVESLTSLVGEAVLKGTKDGIIIHFTDPSNICLCKVTLKNSSYQFFQENKIRVNLDDLLKISKCKGSDKSKGTLILGNKVYLDIYSEKHKALLPRYLEPLDEELEKENDPLESLLKYNYPATFDLYKEQFGFLLENIGLYADVISTDITPELVKFEESGLIGKGSVKWKKKDLKNFELNFDILQKEIDNNIDNTTKELNMRIITDKKVHVSFSTTFLNDVSKMKNAMLKDDDVSKMKNAMLKDCKFETKHKSSLNRHIKNTKHTYL